MIEAHKHVYMKTCLFRYKTIGSEHMFTSLILLYLVGTWVYGGSIYSVQRLFGIIYLEFVIFVWGRVSNWSTVSKGVFVQAILAVRHSPP